MPVRDDLGRGPEARQDTQQSGPKGYEEKLSEVANEAKKTHSQTNVQRRGGKGDGKLYEQVIRLSKSFGR